LPGLAAVAIQQGPAAAQNVWRTIQGKPRRSFRYLDRGSMTTVGRAEAVVEFGRLHLSGLPAWLMWLTVHLVLLIGFDNRLRVLLQWTWWYFTHELGARLITQPCRVGQPVDSPGYGRGAGGRARVTD
jgi:NADH dehydrogenase